MKIISVIAVIFLVGILMLSGCIGGEKESPLDDEVPEEESNLAYDDGECIITKVSSTDELGVKIINCEFREVGSTVASLELEITNKLGRTLEIDHGFISTDWTGPSYMGVTFYKLTETVPDGGSFTLKIDSFKIGSGEFSIKHIEPEDMLAIRWSEGKDFYRAKIEKVE